MTEIRMSQNLTSLSLSTICPGKVRKNFLVISKKRVFYLLTDESVLIVATGDLMFLRSHTLTVLSSLPDTTFSCPANTAVVTGL
jgi:hypothetical protein